MRSCMKVEFVYVGGKFSFPEMEKNSAVFHFVNKIVRKTVGGKYCELENETNC